MGVSWRGGPKTTAFSSMEDLVFITDNVLGVA